MYKYQATYYSFLSTKKKIVTRQFMGQADFGKNSFSGKVEQFGLLESITTLCNGKIEETINS